MARHICPQCGSEKATIVMLPGAPGPNAARMEPTYRCLECDKQWKVGDSSVPTSEAPTAGERIGAEPEEASDRS